MSALTVHLPLFFSMLPPPACSTLFPYTTLFRSVPVDLGQPLRQLAEVRLEARVRLLDAVGDHEAAEGLLVPHLGVLRSEEHTSELQSQFHLVCRLLLEKKKN